jgi:hypothetical protein
MGEWEKLGNLLQYHVHVYMADMRWHIRKRRTRGD